MAESSSSASGTGPQAPSGRVVASSVKAPATDIEQLADRVYRLMREDLKLQLRRAGRR
ncbi:hypothetical protein [Deinococcus sp. Leaf326]|jgi:hypothetical protein|uniref:hypothetical protein n=1 Tax=Deinococcus sp. Leaf326 TaxID=1736338 RepID=UPI000B0C2414|nr:hypothetical protein [Deinococcus sp. Leaf326]